MNSTYGLSQLKNETHFKHDRKKIVPAHNFLLVNGSFYVKAVEITVETNIVLIRWKMAGGRGGKQKKKNLFPARSFY